MLNLGSSYFHVPLTTVRHLLTVDYAAADDDSDDDSDDVSARGTHERSDDTAEASVSSSSGSAAEITREQEQRHSTDDQPGGRSRDLPDHLHFCSTCDTESELSMGPFCVTRSNPTHQLSDPTRRITSGKIWTQSNTTNNGAYSLVVTYLYTQNLTRTFSQPSRKIKFNCSVQPNLV